MVIETSSFIDKIMNKFGIEEFCGVSDSTLKYMINEVTNRGIYKAFTNEGDAVAYAAGRVVAGHPTAVMMQNSGLTNASSPISSLTSLYNIPMLYIVGWRGCPSDVPDEPQHKFVGRNTFEMIRSITPENTRIYYLNPKGSLDLVEWRPRSDLSCQTFILIDRQVKMTPVSFNESVDEDSEKEQRLNRLDCIRIVKKLAKEQGAKVLATTGFTSRELMSLGEEDPDNFYMLGSMGCIVPFTYGIAQSYPDKKFIILDGDGSFLMRPEATYVCHQYFDYMKNILHIIFNNGSHQSTGGQTIPSDNLREILPTLTSETELEVIKRSDEESLFEMIVGRWLKYDNALGGPRATLLVNTSKIPPENLPRPQLTPEEILENFKFGLNHQKEVKS